MLLKSFLCLFGLCYCRFAKRNRQEPYDTTTYLKLCSIIQFHSPSTQYHILGGLLKFNQFVLSQDINSFQ